MTTSESTSPRRDLTCSSCVRVMISSGVTAADGRAAEDFSTESGVGTGFVPAGAAAFVTGYAAASATVFMSVFVAAPASAFTADFAVVFSETLSA